MASRVRPATIVGSAKGRSMSAFTTLFPRKSSRTSTQAIIVPVTAFTATTKSDAAKVSFSAATAVGEVTSRQNASSPPSTEAATTAAIGSSTMRPRYAVEKARAHVRPAAQVGDREEAGGRRVVELGEDVLHDGAVALLAEDALGIGRTEVVDEPLRRGLVRARADDCDRILDQDRLVRDDVLEGLAGRLGEDRLV